MPTGGITGGRLCRTLKTLVLSSSDCAHDPMEPVVMSSGIACDYRADENDVKGCCRRGNRVAMSREN